jgi:hypothetical protein
VAAIALAVVLTAGGGAPGATSQSQVAYRLYSAPGQEGYSAKLPGGDGWAKPVQQHRNGTLRTTVTGPGGAVAVIDRTTAGLPVGPERGAETIRTLAVPTFGRGDEFVVPRHTSTAPCDELGCMAVRVSDDQGGAWQVLVATADLDRSREIAERIAESLYIRPERCRCSR